MSAAELWTCTNEEYHADVSADSFSSLSLFNESPAKYFAIRSGKQPRDEETDAQRLGNLVHAMVLEPAAVAERYVVSPKFDRRFKDQKAAAKAFDEQYAGFKVIDVEEWGKACSMAEAVVSDPTFQRLVADQERVCEQGIRWTGPHGARLKCRRDMWLPESRVVLDLKSIGQTDLSVANLNRSIEMWNYFAQASLYLDGTREMHGVEAAFAWVFVSSKPPHEVAVLTWPYDDFALGRELYSTWVKRLVACRELNVYQRPGAGRVQTGGMSSWKRKQVEEEILT